MKTARLLCVEVACDYCGAALEVTAAQMGGDAAAHPYVCPQCGKDHELVSEGIPHVRVMRPRTDGKDGRYQQTMF